MLTGVKGALASLGGYAALDPASAPWSEQLWAMGGRVGSGLRVIVNTVFDYTTSLSAQPHPMRFILRWPDTYPA